MISNTTLAEYYQAQREHPRLQANLFLAAPPADGSSSARIVSGGALDAPWGLAIAPSGWGSVAGSLLVGNFGDGRINIIARHGGHFAHRITGQVLVFSTGQPFVEHLGSGAGSFNLIRIYPTRGAGVAGMTPVAIQLTRPAAQSRRPVKTGLYPGGEPVRCAGCCAGRALPGAGMAAGPVSLHVYSERDGNADGW